MNPIDNVPFDQIHVGETASISRIISQVDIELLALMTGDVDPFHLEGTGGASARSGYDATEAVGAVAIIAALLGTKLPGPGMRIATEEFTFHGTIQVGDQLTATVRVVEKQMQGKLVRFDCRCVNQSGVELVRGTATVEAPTESIRYSNVIPPQLLLRRGDAFVHLLAACENIPPIRCAVVHPCDRESLLGAVEAATRKIIEPYFIGPVDRIQAVARELGIDLGSRVILSVPHSHAAAAKAVEMARAGDVEALMKGSLHTDELMAAIVPAAAGMRTARRISHVFVMDVPSYPRTLLITDAAINISPDLEAKVDIVQNAIDLARTLGIERPKVAILSAVETVNPKIASTLEAAALCKMAERGQITGGILDGPLAFDNAISLRAATAKGIVSPVAGEADILVVPDLEAGNMLAKQLSYLAGAEAAGIVLGAKVPIVLTSRADSVRARLASTAVMALVSNARKSELPPRK